ncbi:6151_t:CDS:10 [Funneliformis mosseae]|uniref:Carboxypeptidase n=1 Tax=Funneliformis mosseae TaxID=27381 RepID=A0A9N8ZG60_FUNMO|nr:6151_t:CDS:10 [Funneliformis mosseae]
MKYILRALALGIGLIVAVISKITEAAGASEYFVRSLPGLPENATIKSHAGHILLDQKTNSNAFFWLIHNQHISDTPKFVLDVQVDFPVGTGFSFANSNSYSKNVTQVSQQFLLFLDKFFEIFPEYTDDDMYLSGESYAGTFIPYMASSILKRNSVRKTAENKKYNLKGIAIGNGWIDPVSQYNAYYTFTVEKGLLVGEDKNTAENQLEKCMNELKKKPAIHLDICEQILQTILKHSKDKVGENETCINQYDIRDHSDTYPSCGFRWPYELSTITEYLRRPDVIGAIHAEQQQIGWVECNLGVGRDFDNDPNPPSITLLPDLLKQIDVLLYNGDQDLICNINGMQDMLDNLEWNGYKGFKNLTELSYYVNNTQVGHILAERNLTYVVVYNASHMVPYDAPLTSMDMMYRFIGLDHHLVNKWPSAIGIEENEVPDSNEENWDKYYNVGSFTLIIVIGGLLGLGAFVIRNKLRKRRNTSQAMKAAVVDESGEMEELVIETPLFQSDDVDHFGDSEPEDDNNASSSSSRIRERNQGSRYQDEDDVRDERMRLRPSDDR